LQVACETIRAAAKSNVLLQIQSLVDEIWWRPLESGAPARCFTSARSPLKGEIPTKYRG